MKKQKYQIRVGTSGWHYPHWIERFYPADLPKYKWLEYYVQHFDTVELNNTFYNLPKATTFENWRKRAPDDFLFTVKANRYITHVKKIKDVTDSVARFFENAMLLKEKLGPVLYQLPPSLHKDLARLEVFLKLLPPKIAAVFEFRHTSWYSDDILELLKSYNAAFCVHDLGKLTTPKAVTADIIYVRFHGATGRYEGDYPAKELQKWGDWISQHKKNTTAAYAYFNNDYNAYAVKNAKELREILT